MKIPVKLTRSVILLASLSFFAISAQARSVPLYPPIQGVLEMAKAKKKLRDDIQFYFSDQPHPASEATLRKGLVVHKKASKVDRTDEEACHIAMLEILRVFQAHARRAGGNAVVNIESYYKRKSFRSEDRYECFTGSAKSGVILRGDIVRLAE